MLRDLFCCDELYWLAADLPSVGRSSPKVSREFEPMPARISPRLLDLLSISVTDAYYFAALLSSKFRQDAAFGWPFTARLMSMITPPRPEFRPYAEVPADCVDFDCFAS